MPIDNTLLKRLKENDTTLIELDLSCQKLTSLDMQTLLDALANNTSLQKINLTGNNFGPEGGRLLAQLPVLTLSVSNCQLGDEGVQFFKQNNRLKALF